MSLMNSPENPSPNWPMKIDTLLYVVVLSFLGLLSKVHWLLGFTGIAWAVKLYLERLHVVRAKIYAYALFGTMTACLFLVIAWFVAHGAVKT